jgi:hypothetical protein
MEYIVDIGSFEIAEEEKSFVESMDVYSQREWLIQQIRSGFCDIDQIIPN